MAAEVAVGAGQEASQDQIVDLIGTGVKKMGLAKAGGNWYRSQAGKLYRIQEINGEYKLMETKEQTVPAQKKQTKKSIIGPSRKELMAQAKKMGIKYHRILNRQELIDVLHEGATADDIKHIVETAIKRWKKI